MKILIISIVIILFVFILIPIFIISCFVKLTWNNIKKGYIILFSKK